MFIYLDESGDLGFDFTKAKTSRKFMITLLVCHSQSAQRDIKKAIYRTLRNKINRKKKDRSRLKEMKGAKTTLEIKRYFYKHIQNDEWVLYSVVLNKQRVFENLKTPLGRNRLYNYLSRFLLDKFAFKIGHEQCPPYRGSK
jgi:hypothetical protein